MQSAPLVTVGIPTYNRADGLERTLNAIVGQTYSHLEIIVSDNASTDPAVQQVIECFKASDPRVRSIRHETNQGVWNNFNCLPDLGQGKYFMWAADDDLWEPFVIEGLVRELDADPELILAAFDSQYMLYDGTRLPYLPEGRPFHGVEKNTSKRVLKVIATHSYNNLIYGVFRREILVGKDRLLVFEDVKSGSAIASVKIAIRGPYKIIPKVAFYPTTYLEGYLKMAEWLGVVIDFSALPKSATDPSKIVDKSVMFLFPALYKKTLAQNKSSFALRLIRAALKFMFSNQKFLTPISVGYHVLITAKDLWVVIIESKNISRSIKVLVLAKLILCSLASCSKAVLKVFQRLLSSNFYENKMNAVN